MREMQRREDAEAAAETAKADAEEALDEAREARRELRDLAVVMYVDPPQQLQVAAALNGGMSERLAAESLLAAKSDLSQRAAARTERAERRADRLARAADRAVLEAREGAARAEEQMATYAAQVEQRQAAVDLATLQTTALFAEIGNLAQLSPSLETAMGIQSAIASGSVRVAVGADGTWSVATVGFPGAGDIVRIVGTTITVHRLIADQVAALLNAAAADGVVLDGWGYRDTQRQIELRRAHCGPSAEAVFAAPSSSCSPPTARPGRSMHERGSGGRLQELQLPVAALLPVAVTQRRPLRAVQPAVGAVALVDQRQLSHATDGPAARLARIRARGRRVRRGAQPVRPARLTTRCPAGAAAAPASSRSRPMAIRWPSSSATLQSMTMSWTADAARSRPERSPGRLVGRPR